MTRLGRWILVALGVALAGPLLAGCGTTLDPADVQLEAACVDGCTLTLGYWKTHSEYGPAGSADPAWDLLPDGADTPFFTSGQSYYQVLWTPAKGNAYYILAHQFVAATLNELAGATITGGTAEVFAVAEGWLADHDSDDPFWKANRSYVTYKAGILDDFNNGLREVPHCD